MAATDSKPSTEEQVAPTKEKEGVASFDEEDEFEEFEDPDWKSPSGEQDPKQWEEDWDDWGSPIGAS